jgi:hypothetical protein
MQIGKSPLDATYAALIKPIRNQMRRFDYLSLFDTLLVYLNPPAPINSEKLIRLKRLPWVAEKLALWLLADASYKHSYGKLVATESDVRKLLNQAWNSVDSNLVVTKAIDHLSLFMRQLMLAQAPYQDGIGLHAYALQLHLLNKLEFNSNLRKFLDDKAGMPIDEYFEIAFLFWIKTATDEPWINQKYVDALTVAFPREKIINVLKSLTISLSDLQSLCSSRTITADEWFQPTHFYRTPCIWHQDACVPFGRETFRRYFESLIGDWIAESSDSKLRHDYDRLIEDYVADSLHRGFVKHFREDHIRKLVPVGHKIVDFMIEDNESIVLLEVKNKGLSRAIPADQNSQTLRAKLNGTIIKAQTQLASIEQTLRSNMSLTGKRFSKIIVTNNDLWIKNSELLTDNNSQVSHTWIISLRELDMLIGAVTKAGKSIACFVSEYEFNQTNPATGTHSIGAFLEKIGQKPEKIPAHLSNELDLALEKLKSLLPNEEAHLK